MIELMMVVSIIAILASIAIPKYADMLKKAQEGNLRGQLNSLRSALSIYTADNEGQYPSCLVGANSSMLNNVLVPKYLPAIPPVNNALHPSITAVYCDYAPIPGSIHDAQGWYYDGALPADGNYGGVWVACDHTDIINSVWTSY